MKASVFLWTTTLSKQLETSPTTVHDPPCFLFFYRVRAVMDIWVQER